MVAPGQPDTPARFSASVPARERLIVALDFPTGSLALAFVDSLANQCRWFKVGLELFLAEGPGIVEQLTRRGHAVFLDLKLHDIPNTVAGAVRSAAASGAALLTLHAAGGPAMLAAAAEAAAGLARAPRLLAVTVLTSMDRRQLAAIGIAALAADQVMTLAGMAHAAGIHGFVSSAEEVRALREQFRDATLVIPGIRPAGATLGDQKRTATPADALRNGADYLVVGRPITQAAHPAQAAEAILKEIAAHP